MSALDEFPLIQALLNRRSRRFGKGMTLDGGELSYTSRHPPEPLSLEEEALLAFAACGITGPILAELPFEPGSQPESGGGNILMNFLGRTVPSGDASHNTAVIVINDGGAWLMKRPQDLDQAEARELIELAQARRWVDLYLKSRVQIADKRI